MFGLLNHSQTSFLTRMPRILKSKDIHLIYIIWWMMILDPQSQFMRRCSHPAVVCKKGVFKILQNSQ